MKQEKNGGAGKIQWKQAAIRIALLAAVLLCVWIVSKLGGDFRQEEAPQEISEQGNAQAAPDIQGQEIAEPSSQEPAAPETAVIYHFRSDTERDQHFEKHGAEFDYQTPEEYEAGANRVIADERALHKSEKEDGDDVYYLEETNEFVVVSPKGVIRTYFRPSAGKAYYDRQ